ncbi:MULTISPECIES: type IVB secretion system protein IcmH/DotU [unclassified Pseudomonas]|uniref:type IVB secretion system protein IcmH/DotU n=1 Tax=unclassified Pseudomonas TaxID=196821 RepID=UPI001199FEE6|nr:MULTISPECIES: type IVB secretion system protein IcmH/DotU [unclassified Pseudomonas]TWC06646.1 type VI secretion system protein ImpK [Pseudomonas sp. SJZ075]TWC26628.1 type VI secretion system protein ImpK [Pseudomonas sp. SJZ078]TWC45365.1 type VI secretion system protein ImpK [Pseudomonas sp. SJZ124]TWC46143.1 type VI secretion system protein ImpK [Pseudomonas sp. SJZ080]TWC80446.1 type VI secretion system protein ImpK [Pseudomonas sp. SJZ101]
MTRLLPYLKARFRRAFRSRTQQLPEALPPLNSDRLAQRASDLLYEVVLLRGLEQAPDLNELRARLVTQIRTFHRQALDDATPAATVERAQYAICTLLDETISGSEWGRGGWSKHSLLMIFHGQTSGGDGFFAYLDSAELKPQENLALLELMYLCLALGLEGRYRIQSEGRAALAVRRNQLFETIRLQRGYLPKARLDEHLRSWSRGYFNRRRHLWWGCGVLLVALASGLAYHLESRSYQTMVRLQALEQAPLITLTQQMAEQLSADLRAGRLNLLEDGQGVRMIISSSGLFAPGSSEVAAPYQPVLRRIAAALDQWPGQIKVVGHSDDTPVARRLISNQALSLARAEAVLRWLVSEQLDPSRFFAEGRGEFEPLLANDSPDNRARNRRVEIFVYPAGY